MTGHLQHVTALGGEIRVSTIQPENQPQTPRGFPSSMLVEVFKTAVETHDEELMVPRSHALQAICNNMDWKKLDPGMHAGASFGLILTPMTSMTINCREWQSSSDCDTILSKVNQHLFWEWQSNSRRLLIMKMDIARLREKGYQRWLGVPVQSWLPSGSFSLDTKINHERRCRFAVTQNL